MLRPLARAWLALAAWLALVAPAAAEQGGAAQPAAKPAAAKPAREAAEPVAPTARLAERARQLFDEGVKLAGSGHFDLARAAFRGAYELRPHPSVLYNIAQCEVQLGEHAAAITSLQRFLDSSGPELPPEQRRPVEQQLAELRARTRAVDDGVVAPRPAAAPAAVVVPPARPARPEPVAIRPFLLAGAGVVLLGTAAGLYIWNDSRHDAWRSERDQLARTPGLETQLARNAELWERARASNERLESIQTIDVATLIVTGVGLAALGAGAWDFLEQGEAPPLQVGGTTLLRWQGRW